MKNSNDDVRVLFDDDENMDSYLTDMADTENWIHDVPVRNLHVVSAATPDEVNRLYGGMADDAAINTAESGTKLYLATDDGKLSITPIRKAALQSFFDRFAISGQALKDMSSEDLCTVLNLAGKTRDGNAMISIVDGKINAVLSDNEKNGLDYSHLPLAGIFESTINKLYEIANDQYPTSFNGQWSYAGIVGMWVIPLEKTFGGKTYSTKVTLATSDNGTSAVIYSADLTDGDTNIPLIDALKVPHRQANGEADVSVALDMLSAGLDKEISHLDHLSKIQIDYPRPCLTRLWKSIKFPKKICKPMLEFLETYIPSGKVTAADLYILSSKVYTEYCSKQDNLQWQMKMRNNLHKLVAANWKKNDTDGVVEWK